MSRWAVACALSMLCGASTATSLLIDMDQGSTPRLTEPGAASVGFCTLLSGQTPDPGCALIADFGAIGYLGSSRPYGDFLVLPAPTSTLPDLWADGHRVFPSGATLRISGLAPASYAITLMSHNPAGNDLDSTVFSVNGAGPFEIQNVRDPDDLLAQQTLTIPVTVGAEGTIDLFYRAGGALRTGVLNGISLEVVPEPASLAMLALGVAALARVSRR